MSRRLRTLLATVLTIVLVGAGSTTAWAVWTATGVTASSVTIGKMSATISGTNAMTTTFSSSTASVTRPITLTNSGTIPGTASTSASVVRGSSTDLARAITVTAWPVSSTAACTSTTAVGSTAVTGTWANLPSMTTNLPAGASAVWCVRSTPTSAAPASSTTNIILGLAVTNGTWTSGTVQGGFYLNTSAAGPAATCTDHGGNYVEVAWPASSRPKDTWYAAYIGDTRVGDRQQDYFGRVTLAPSQIPASVATTGTITVIVKALDDADRPTSTIAGTTKLTLFTQNNGAAIRCGA